MSVIHLERCHPRRKPLTGKVGSPNGDSSNSVLVTGELSGCPHLAPIQQDTTFDPHAGGFPPGPTVSQCLHTYTRGGASSKDEYYDPRNKFPSLLRPVSPKTRPSRPPGEPRWHPGSRGRGPLELTYFESPRAPPVTAATGWRERSSWDGA